jgi:hypothetical protein
MRILNTKLDGVGFWGKILAIAGKTTLIRNLEDSRSRSTNTLRFWHE